MYTCKAVDGKSRKVAIDKAGIEIGWDDRLRLRPEGCASCRRVVGCTPTCWKKRLFFKDLVAGPRPRPLKLAIAKRDLPDAPAK